MTKKLEKTEYITLTGIANWAKPYKPDEFRGTSRWTLNLELDEASLARYKEYGIQQKLKETSPGKFSFNPRRDVLKHFRKTDTTVYFTPPFIYDKKGEPVVRYTDDNGKNVFSYNNKDEKITRVGDPVLIGNGSVVEVRLSVYNTDMGVGNRLESITLLDLIEFNPDSVKEQKTESEVDKIDW